MNVVRLHREMNDPEPPVPPLIHIPNRTQHRRINELRAQGSKRTAQGHVHWLTGPMHRPRRMGHSLPPGRRLASRTCAPAAPVPLGKWQFELPSALPPSTLATVQLNSSLARTEHSIQLTQPLKSFNPNTHSSRASLVANHDETARGSQPRCIEIEPNQVRGEPACRTTTRRRRIAQTAAAAVRGPPREDDDVRKQLGPRSAAPRREDDDVRKQLGARFVAHRGKTSTFANSWA